MQAMPETKEWGKGERFKALVQAVYGGVVLFGGYMHLRLGWPEEVASKYHLLPWVPTQILLITMAVVVAKTIAVLRRSPSSFIGLQGAGATIVVFGTFYKDKSFPALELGASLLFASLIVEAYALKTEREALSSRRASTREPE